jgi:hypothetical protein
MNDLHEMTDHYDGIHEYDNRYPDGGCGSSWARAFSFLLDHFHLGRGSIRS